jgi:hypothetical protein
VGPRVSILKPGITRSVRPSLPAACCLLPAACCQGFTTRTKVLHPSNLHKISLLPNLHPQKKLALLLSQLDILNLEMEKGKSRLPWRLFSGFCSPEAPVKTCSQPSPDHPRLSQK